MSIFSAWSNRLPASSASVGFSTPCAVAPFIVPAVGISSAGGSAGASSCGVVGAAAGPNSGGIFRSSERSVPLNDGACDTPGSDERQQAAPTSCRAVPADDATARAATWRSQVATPSTVCPREEDFISDDEAASPDFRKAAPPPLPQAIAPQRQPHNYNLKENGNMEDVKDLLLQLSHLSAGSTSPKLHELPDNVRIEDPEPADTLASTLEDMTVAGGLPHPREPSYAIMNKLKVKDYADVSPDIAGGAARMRIEQLIRQG